MDNPSRILQELDARLNHVVRLTLCECAALWLGFENPPPETGTTKDIDAIISLSQAGELEKDPAFWDAVEATNAALAAEGLYITHLFSEAEVFLRRQWHDHLEPISRLPLTHLQLSRPATIDLVLTKMMRGDDPQDLADAESMVRQDMITKSQLIQAFIEMKPIELEEFQEAFNRAKPLFLNIAETINPE